MNYIILQLPLKLALTDRADPTADCIPSRAVTLPLTLTLRFTVRSNRTADNKAGNGYPTMMTRAKLSKPHPPTKPQKGPAAAPARNNGVAAAAVAVAVTEPQSPFDLLPDELLHHVLSYVGSRWILTKVHGVCRRWREACMHTEVELSCGSRDPNTICWPVTIHDHTLRNLAERFTITTLSIRQWFCKGDLKASRTYPQV